MSLQRVRSTVWDTSDNLVVNTLADLVKVEAEGIIFVSGGTTPNDGSGGWFRYMQDMSRSQHDGNDIIDPTATGQGRGCWVRQHFTSAPPSKSYSEVQTAAAGQDTFRLTQFRYTPGSGGLTVYLNGTRLTPFSYTELDPQTVVMDHPLRARDVVEFVYQERLTSGTGTDIMAARVEFLPGNTTMVSTNVQAALEEIDLTLHTLAPGGTPAIINAANVKYQPVAPDTSNNVQASIHWLQDGLQKHIVNPNGAHQAYAVAFTRARTRFQGNNLQQVLEEVDSLLGQGTASEIAYDPTSSTLTSRDVQAALDELDFKAVGLDADIRGHLTDNLNAHMSSSIGLNTTHSMFINKPNVSVALDDLAKALQNHAHNAAGIDIDSTNYPSLGVTVQAALERLAQEVEEHGAGTYLQHAAAHVTVDTANSPYLIHDHLQDVLEDLANQAIFHLRRTSNAHDASTIRYIPNGIITANDVQDAILQAAAGRLRFRGVVDLTVPFDPNLPQLRNPVVSEMWLTFTQGAVDPSWVSKFPAGEAPAQVTGEAVIVYDGTVFWWAPFPLMTGVIYTHPGTGVNQAITVANPGDTALTLAGVTGQTAPLLDVRGNVTVSGNLLGQNELHDANGNVRQVAAEVAYDLSRNPLIQAGSYVQSALDELTTVLHEHLTARAHRHNASMVTFTSLADVPAVDVQHAIENVQRNLVDHQNSVTAHRAANILFDSSQVNLAAINVQAALEALVTKVDGHAANAQAHSAASITFNPQGSNLLALTVQAGMIELWDIVDDHIQRGTHEASLIDFNGQPLNVWLTDFHNTYSAHGHTAISVSFNPTGSPDITGTNVQTALQQLAVKADIPAIDCGTF